MLHVVLYEPEIPPNTGNIIRLCANAGAILHLIHPLGFELDTKSVRRAGLDYHDLANVHEYSDFNAYIEAQKPHRLFACSTKATKYYSDARFQDGDTLMMGPETRGLPASILDHTADEFKIKIPMRAGSRSLNLSNATAIILYEAWRQIGFK